MRLPTHRLAGRLTGLDRRSLPDRPDEVAPDGCEVRWLGRTAGASMARFSLPAGATSSAVVHRQVAEIWYFLAGSGEMWWQHEDVSEIVPVAEGVSLTIPPGCGFQLRADPGGYLVAVAVTTPPWPGDDEAGSVEGPWAATIGESAQGR